MDFADAVSRNMKKRGSANMFTPQSHTFIDKLQRPRSIQTNFSRRDMVNAAELY